MSDKEEEARVVRNNKLLVDAMMTRMEQMMNMRLAALQQEQQLNREQSASDNQQRRGRGRAHRREANRPRQRRDEETASYYSPDSESTLNSQRINRRIREGRAQSDNFGGLKLRIPPFHGKNDPDAYLEWEKKIELVFNCQHYTEINRVRVAVTEFYDYALSWWDQLVTSRRRNEEYPIETWAEMKSIMRKRFVPTHYHMKGSSRTNYGTGNSFSKPSYVREEESAYQRHHKPFSTSKPENKTPPTQVSKDKAEIKTSNVRCFKSQGRGHYANECSNKRVMILKDNGEIDSADEPPSVEPSDFEHEELPMSGELLVARRTLSVQNKSKEHEQRENLFHSRCLVQSKVCSLVPLSPLEAYPNLQAENEAVEQVTFLKMSLKAKCILPYVQSEFVLEKLTPFESEKPSSIVSFSQILQEQPPRKIQRSLSLDCELEQPSNFEPEHVLMPFPCDYPRKYCKEIDLVRTEPNLFVMISAQDENRFGFEKVKEFRVSNSVFDQMISSFETSTHEEFSKPKGFLFREFSSSLRVSLCSNTFELFRSKTGCAFDITHLELKFLLKNVLFESSEFCKLNVNDHVSNRSLFMVNSFTSKALLVLRFVKNFWCSNHVLNCELLVLRFVKDFWCSNHVLNYEKLFEVHKKQPELVSDVLIKENMFEHLRDLFIYSSRTFDVFSLVLVKAKERQVKDSKTGIVPDLANQINYGPKKEKNQTQSHITASKRSQRMINNFGIWNWKYLRKTTPNAQGCSILKFYLAIIFMIICLNFFVVTKLFPFDVGDLAFSQFKYTNQKQGIVVTTFSMFKDEPPDAFYMLRSNNNFQQASMIHAREKEIAFAKISSFVLKDSLISYHTDMICLSLLKEPNTGFRAALKRMRKTEKREEYQQIKPPDLNQDKHKKISSFIQIKDAPPDATYKLNSSYNIFEGKIQMLQDYGSDFVHFMADQTDLRTNPFQVGEDDMIMEDIHDLELESSEEQEVKELEPEQLVAQESMCIPSGPMTRAMSRRLKTTVTGLLQLAYDQGSDLPQEEFTSTLVVIQVRED